MLKFAPDFWRSKLPRACDIATFAATGGASVLDLTSRPRPTVERAARQRGLVYRKHALSHEFTRDEVDAAVAIALTLPRPLLVHCFHGRDRTGAVARGIRAALGLSFAVHLRGVGRNLNRAVRSAYSLGADKLVAIDCTIKLGDLREAKLLPLEFSGEPSAGAVVLCQRARRTVLDLDWRTVSGVCVGGETHGWPQDGLPRVAIPSLPLELTVEAALTVALWERARCAY